MSNFKVYVFPFVYLKINPVESPSVTGLSFTIIVWYWIIQFDGFEVVKLLNSYSGTFPS